VTAKIIDGNKIAKEILDSLKDEMKGLDPKPGLAVVLVGKDPASVLYTSKKVEACEELGIISERFELADDISGDELLKLIDKLNKNDKVHGILVQLPLPKHIDENKIIEAIDPRKDVDGFHPQNLGKLMIGSPGLAACTSIGCLKLIESTGIELKGKEAVVVGASNIVGKPMFFLLQNQNMTVTLCDEHTVDLASHTKKADVLVVATGVPNLINKDMVKAGAVVIDVGTTRQGKKVVGDVDFDAVKEIAGFITPVPGGAGPMTIACLMENTLKAYKNL